MKIKKKVCKDCPSKLMEKQIRELKEEIDALKKKGSK